MLRKLLAGSVAVATLATASVTSTPAAADRGAALAAGIIGGVIIGGAFASAEADRRERRIERRYYVEPRPTYYYEPVRRCRNVLVEDYYGRQYWEKVCR